MNNLFFFTLPALYSQDPFYSWNCPLLCVCVLLEQNCRLSIWNLQSGKNVRTYKTEAVKGELYKSDIDPSGINEVSNCLCVL